MRRVNRQAVAVPPSLMGPCSRASKELERAAKHYRDTPDKEFKFSVYSEHDVREALNQLFHGKYTYWESPIIATQPTDIEHFRPKGRIHECPDHPGYWWLAACWQNLLASCIDCNRRRYQDAAELAGAPLPNVRNGRFNLGKGDLFPILGAAYARTQSCDLVAEDPALIDPTGRNPQDHLQWLIKEGKNLIGPVVRDGNVDQYGHHTYQIFGLNRQGLVELRTELWLEIQRQLIGVRDRLKLGVTVPEPYGRQMRDMAFRELEALTRFTAPNQPYSAMVEQLLAEETEKLLKEYMAYLP